MNASPQKFPRLYFISGLGGDHRLFDPLKGLGLSFTCLPFLEPEKKESLRSYAQRMAAMIDVSEPFILGGVSFGGMLACEIAQFLEPELLLLISTVKTGREFPFHLKIFRYFPVHRLLSGETIKRLAPGVSASIIGQDNRAVLDQMKKEASPRFVEWAVHQAVWYRNKVVPKRFIHIHGTQDHLLPFKGVKDAIPVSKGSHVMVMDRAQEILDLFQSHWASKTSFTMQSNRQFD